MSKRYVHLKRAVEATVGNSQPKKGYRILDLGYFNGEHAREAIDHAFARGRKAVEYYGFGPFEPPQPSAGKVEKFLRAQTRAVVKTFKGDTAHKLEAAAPTLPPIDLVLFDGGRPLKTVEADWNALQRVIHAKTVVLLDDFYPDDITAGTKHLTEYLQGHPGWDVQVRAPIDGPPDEERFTQVVWLRPKAWPLPEHPVYVAPDSFMTTTEILVPRVPGPPLDTGLRTAIVGDAGSLASLIATGGYELTPTEFTPELEVTIPGTVAKNEDGSLAFTPTDPDKALAEVNALRAKQDAAIAASIDAVESKELFAAIDAEVKKEVPQADEPFRPAVGDHRADVHEVGVREEGGGVGAAEPAEPVPGDGGGRREPGLGEDDLGRVPEEPPALAPLPEERPEPDPVVELGAAEGPGAGVEVRGGGELGREVPAPVVGGHGGRAGRRNRRSGRPDDQRPGAPPPPAGN